MYYPDPYDLSWSLCVEACPYYYIQGYFCVYEKEPPHLDLAGWGCWDAYETTALGFWCIATEEEPRKNMLEELWSKGLKVFLGNALLAWDLEVLVGCFCFLLGVASVLAFSFTAKGIYLVLGVFFVVYGYFVFLLVELDKFYYQLVCGSYGPAEPRTCQELSVHYFLYIASITALGGLYYLFRLLHNFWDLEIGIELLRIATKPLKCIKGIYMYLLVQGAVVLLSTLSFWLLLGYLASIGTTETLEDTSIPGGKSKAIKYPNEVFLGVAFIALMWYWWVRSFISIGEMTLAGAVAVWFFSREKSFLFRPLLSNLKKTVKFHLGSVLLNFFYLFASETLEFLFRPFYNNEKPECWNSLRRFFKLYNKKTLILVSYKQLSVFGNDYRFSAKQLYVLSKNNYTRTAKPTKIGTLLISVLKVTINLAGLCTVVSIIVFSEKTLSGQLTVELASPGGVVLVAFVLGHLMAEVTGGTVLVTLNTLLLCAACDEQMFVRDQRYTQDDLKSLLDSVAEEQNESLQEFGEHFSLKINNPAWVSNEDFTGFSKVRPSASLSSRYQPNIPEIQEESKDESMFTGRKAKYV